MLYLSPGHHGGAFLLFSLIYLTCDGGVFLLVIFLV